MSKTKKRLLLYISLEFVSFLILLLIILNQMLYDSKNEENDEFFDITSKYVFDSIDSYFENNNYYFNVKNDTLYYGNHIIGNGTISNKEINFLLSELENKTNCYISILLKIGNSFKYVANSYSQSNIELSADTIVGKQYEKLEKNNFINSGNVKSNYNGSKEIMYYKSFPIKDNEGNVIGLLALSKSEAVIYNKVKLFTKNIIYILLLLIPGFIIGLNIITKRWTKATNKINNYIRNININNLPEKKLVINNKDEFDEIANSINIMVDDIKNSKRLFTEVKMASNIQQKMLPNLSYIKEFTNIQLDAKMIPAKEIGGDLYNTFKIDDDHIFISIADISGKGIPAATIMSMLTSLIKIFSKIYNDPSKILYELNNLMLDNETSLFVTCFIGILNIQTGELIYSNAGHNRPLIISENTFELECDSNIALGVTSNYNYTNQTYKLKSDDYILLYTDGIIESINNSNLEYGLKRLIKFINENNKNNLLNKIYDDVKIFTEDQDQFDDMTSLLVKYSDNKSIKLKSDINELKKINQYIRKTINLDSKEINNVELALEELFVNIVNYSKTKDDIILNINCINKKLTITLIDSGIEFNPLTIKDPDINTSIEEKELGGLGLFIVKQLFDNIDYHYINSKNILILEKEINNENKKHTRK